MIYGEPRSTYCFRDVRAFRQTSQFKEIHSCTYSGSNRPTPIS